MGRVMRGSKVRNQLRVKIVLTVSEMRKGEVLNSFKKEYRLWLGNNNGADDQLDAVASVRSGRSRSSKDIEMSSSICSDRNKSVLFL